MSDSNDQSVSTDKSNKNELVDKSEAGATAEDVFYCHDPDGKTYKVAPQVPNEEADSQYPKSWFDQNPNKKPGFTTPYKEVKDLDKMSMELYTDMGNSAMRLDVAIQFLSEFGKTIQASSPTDWKSFGRLIAEQGKEVNAVSPLDLPFGTAEYQPKDVTGTLTSEQKKLIVFYLLMIHRMNRINNATQKTNMINKAILVQAQFGSKTIQYDQMLTSHPTFYNDKRYTTLVASYDMFFSRFPTHQDGKLRLGSTGSRYKDCNVLQSMTDLMGVLGLKHVRQLAIWVFNVNVMKEIVKISERGQEMSDVYSYFPYQVDMNIVNKSKYSSSLNPALHLWLHCIGCFVRHTRSQNSKAFNTNEFLDLAYQATLVALAKKQSIKLTQFITETSDKPEPPEVTKEITEDSVDLGGIEDPTGWFNLASQHNCEVFPIIESFWKKAIQALSDSRDETIGKALHKSLPLWMKEKEEK